MNYRRDFIIRNIAYFKARSEEATNERIAVMGFYGATVKEAFEELVEHRDENLLGYCFYAIYRGLGVSQDKKFSISAFEEIIPTMETCIYYPALSYVYAYCLNRDGRLEKSEDIIKCLSKHGFPPAIVTQGDLAWVHKQYKNSRDCYLKASNAGHYGGKAMLLRLFGRRKNTVLRVMALFEMLKDNFTKQNTDDKYLYLNFYGLNRKKRRILASE